MIKTTEAQLFTGLFTALLHNLQKRYCARSQSFLRHTGGISLVCPVKPQLPVQDGWLYQPLQAGVAQTDAGTAETGVRKPHKRYSNHSLHHSCTENERSLERCYLIFLFVNCLHIVSSYFIKQFWTWRQNIVSHRKWSSRWQTIGTTVGHVGSHTLHWTDKPLQHYSVTVWEPVGSSHWLLWRQNVVSLRVRAV